MEALRRLYELVRGVYGPLFPTSKRKREEFLDLVRDRVKYYKPRIEDRCKIGLGDVKVKDNKYWLSDVLCYLAYRETIENALKHGRVPTERDFNTSSMLAFVAGAIMYIPLKLYDMVNAADFIQYNGTIYVPFYYTNGFMDTDFKKRTERLDYGVVHELSHILWEKIAGKPEKYVGEFRIWYEGFATYCGDNYFADFYPEGIQKIEYLPKVYTEGKEKIERLVAKHGTQIILEIPNNWREFASSST